MNSIGFYLILETGCSRMSRQTNRILSLPNPSRPTDYGGAYREPLVLQKFRPAATKGFI